MITKIIRKEDLNSKDLEFMGKVKETLLKANEDDNFIRFIVPRILQWGLNSKNIYDSIYLYLVQNEFFHEMVMCYEGDVVIMYQHFTKEGIEIYGLLEEKFGYPWTAINYFILGEEELIIEHYAEIINTIAEAIYSYED